MDSVQLLVPRVDGESDTAWLVRAVRAGHAAARSQGVRAGGVRVTGIRGEDGRIEALQVVLESARPTPPVGAHPLEP